MYSIICPRFLDCLEEGAMTAEVQWSCATAQAGELLLRAEGRIAGF